MSDGDDKKGANDITTTLSLPPSPPRISQCKRRKKERDQPDNEREHDRNKKAKEGGRERENEDINVLM